MTEVVAALIWENGRFLACQRPAHKARGLLWEFVGGKVEQGETREQALVRECREELDVTVTPGEIFMEVDHVYPDLTIHLTLFHAALSEGTPKALEHAQLRWITVDEIDQLPFCPADEEILVKLRLCYGRRTTLQSTLLSLADAEYRSFQAKLMPSVDPARVMGVRMPALRQLEKSLRHSAEAEQFLQQLPHLYYEENNLHALLICSMKDPDRQLRALDDFLPYVDNWATCDLLRPKLLPADKEAFLHHIRRWLSDGKPYTVRFGMEMLMVYYLKSGFDPAQLDWVCDAISEHYYVQMMAAWYYATALAFRYETVYNWHGKCHGQKRRIT